MNNTTDALQPIKSTTVRPRDLAPLWLRAPLQTLGAVSPESAGWLAAQLMARTQRRPVGERESKILETGLEFSVAGVRAWSWGRGPTVLLVHGWNGRATQLGAFVEPLVRSGKRVVAFDFAAHGRSSGKSVTFETLTESLVRVVDLVGPVEAIVAHSAGCVVTTLALMSGARAERLVYIAAPRGPGGWLDDFARQTQITSRVKEALGRRMQHHLGAPLEEVRLSKLAAELPQPLLVIHDRGDSWVPWDSSAELSAAAKQARLISTEGLGHHRILRDTVVIESVRNFVEKGQSS